MQTRYDSILEESKIIWNEFTNGSSASKNAAANADPHYTPFHGNPNNQFIQNHPKTHSIGNVKAKAFDLGSPVK